MNTFNKPPAIPDDTLLYNLYLAPDLSDKDTVTTLAACVQSFVESLLPGFIWHRDPFEVKVVLSDVTDTWALEGRMRVGDCIDDEWCTVWLLREISAKWDCVISVCDSDGEFLLIEAAEALPKWVKPSNSENRVWIYRSRLHLIPLSYVSPPPRQRRRRTYPRVPGNDDEDEVEGIGNAVDENEYIAIDNALKLVRDPVVETEAPPTVENIVWQRISGYPTMAKNHTHVTKAWIPADIAKALYINPSLVQKPIETFYTRDAMQLRAAHKMSRFPPTSAVLRSVIMTRTAFAQLVGQQFFPPKVFGRWTEKEGTREWRWRDIGMKLACGFEMLYQESKTRASDPATEAARHKSASEANKDVLGHNPEYKTYIQNLKSTGYFREELEGSQLWNMLEDKGMNMFIEVCQKDDTRRLPFAALFNASLSQAPSVLQPFDGEEESDEWLSVNVGDLDHMLEQTMGSSTARQSNDPDNMDVDVPVSKEDRFANEQAAQLKNLAAKVEEFVEGEGDLEGARFADEEFSDEEFSDGKLSDSDDEPMSNDEAAATRRAAMDNLVPGIEPSEYGKMPPSFYSNSQRVAPATVETDMPMSIPNVEDQPSGAGEASTKTIRKPLLPRNQYDGVVDSDDESNEEAISNSEDDEDKPQVVGEIEIDMTEEKEEFLEFSRHALGISDEQWAEIVRDRKERGAFVPSSVGGEKPLKKDITSGNPPRVPSDGLGSVTSTGNPPPKANQKLDTFEAVMKAMDAELARQRLPEDSKGKQMARLIDEDLDIEAAMAAELKASLERGESDEGSDEGDSSTDYNLIKHFLESFKSQGGLSGPVSNLAGRLQPGWQLPRDGSQ